MFFYLHTLNRGLPIMTQEELETLSRRELGDIAAELNVKGWRGFKKDQLIEAILKHQEAETERSLVEDEPSEESEEVESTIPTTEEASEDNFTPLDYDYEKITADPVFRTKMTVTEADRFLSSNNDTTTPTVSVTHEQPVKEDESQGENFYLQYAAAAVRNKLMKSDNPGVAFIMKDGNGIDRGIIPVNKKVFDEVVRCHDGNRLDIGSLDVTLTGIDKVQMASVVWTYTNSGRVYVRSNHSSQTFYV